MGLACTSPAKYPRATFSLGQGRPPYLQKGGSHLSFFLPETNRSQNVVLSVEDRMKEDNYSAVIFDSKR